MADLTPQDLLDRMKAAHARERLLIDGLSDQQVRAASALPGWTRGHLLASRIVFMRAVRRQVGSALAGKLIEFYAGGRLGRGAEIEMYAVHPADHLVGDVRQACTALEESWSRVGASDWDRPVTYRYGTLTSLLQASWREAEVHLVDLDLGVLPSDWSAELCAHLFDFLAPRVPDGVRVELTTPDGATWTLGDGERVTVRGTRTDLAAWLAGREPVGSVESSTENLPQLQ